MFLLTHPHPHTLTHHPRGQAVLRILQSALQAVEPQAAVRHFIERREQTLIVDGHEYYLDKFEKILLLGLGKASQAMTLPLLNLLADHAPRGLLIPKQAPVQLLRRLDFQPGGHPVPNENSIRAGEKILELVEYHHVHQGDTVFMPARTIHALGPGLLVYEVQQTSDLTYRVFDWNRPLTGGRELHIDKSLAVSDPQARGQIRRANPAETSLVHCDYFHLERLTAPETRDTHGESFHALTVIGGEAQLQTEHGIQTLKQFDSLIIPAGLGKYQLEGDFQVLCSSVGS